MACAPECASRTNSWAKRIRLAAAIVTIVGGIPGALVTIALVVDWAALSPNTRTFQERGALSRQPPDASWQEGTSVCRPSVTQR